MTSDRLAFLSLADLAVVVAEYTRYCHDQGQIDGQQERHATLAGLRTELRERVLEVTRQVAQQENSDV